MGPDIGTSGFGIKDQVTAIKRVMISTAAPHIDLEQMIPS
jgi:hypothetical protein